MKRTNTILLSHITRAGLKPPKIVTLMITNNCNLQCKHCWPESRPHESATFVPVNTIQRLIEECIMLGVEEICITGGAPLTHPEWAQILQLACRQPGLKRVRIQTNGTLLNESAIETLASTEFEGLIVQISLEGASARSHDHVRGSNSFERAFRGLKLLAQAGLGKNTVVAFTEMEHNFAELPRLLELLDGMGISRLVSGTLVKAGRAALTDELALPTPSQYRELLNRYFVDVEFRKRYKKTGNIAALEWLTGKSNPLSQGCVCIETPYISADGEMYPCVMLPVDKLAAKDIYHRHLGEVLIEIAPLWAELPKLNRRRSVELRNCRNCPGKSHCASGCMGRAYATTGDFMSIEDRCALRKVVYAWENLSGSVQTEGNQSSQT